MFTEPPLRIVIPGLTEIFAPEASEWVEVLKYPPLKVMPLKVTGTIDVTSTKRASPLFAMPSPLISPLIIIENGS